MNPFLELNNRKKPLFKLNNQQYFLRIISKKDTIEKEDQLIKMINQVVLDAEQTLQKNLEKYGKSIELSKREDVFQVDQKWIDKYFDKNGAIFSIENENNKIVAGAFGIFDDAEFRKNLNIKKEIGTFLHVPLTIVDESLRNTGIAGIMFLKVMSMLENPKRDIKKPILYGTSVRLKVDSEGINHLIHLPRYFHMWSMRLENNQIQSRYIGEQEFGGKITDFQDIETDGKCDVNKVNELVAKEKQDKPFNDKLIGYYVRGEQKLDYPQSKQLKDFVIKKLDQKFKAKF